MLVLSFQWMSLDFAHMDRRHESARTATAMNRWVSGKTDHIVCSMPCKVIASTDVCYTLGIAPPNAKECIWTGAVSFQVTLHLYPLPRNSRICAICCLATSESAFG